MTLPWGLSASERWDVRKWRQVVRIANDFRFDSELKLKDPVGVFC